MIEIISGTDRKGSRTRQVAEILLQMYRRHNVGVDLIDLAAMDLQEILGGDYFKGARGKYLEAVERVTRADGVVIVTPEYNGSFPGALKLFIDYWRYPQTFENRPVAYVGLGTRWGGLRPVEHLQQVIGYRSGYNFPMRVFMSNVKDMLQDGRLTDQTVNDLLEIQTRDFLKYITALQAQGLDANSRLKP